MRSATARHAERISRAAFRSSATVREVSRVTSILRHGATDSHPCSSACHAAGFRLTMSRWVRLSQFGAALMSGDVWLGPVESEAVGTWFGPGFARTSRPMEVQPLRSGLLMTSHPGRFSARVGDEVLSNQEACCAAGHRERRQVRARTAVSPTLTPRRTASRPRPVLLALSGRWCRSPW
jgi:hypothetical protein